MPYLIDYAALKNLIGAVLHLSADALHVHFGLVVFLLGVVLIRTRHRYLHALAFLLLVCIIGEFMDLALDYRAGGRIRWLNSAKDIVSTMFWPTICAILAPLVGRRSQPRSQPGSERLQGRAR